MNILRINIFRTGLNLAKHFLGITTLEERKLVQQAGYFKEATRPPSELEIMLAERVADDRVRTEPQPGDKRLDRWVKGDTLKDKVTLKD